jgi:hypothetical protein
MKQSLGLNAYFPLLSQTNVFLLLTPVLDILSRRKWLVHSITFYVQNPMADFVFFRDRYDTSIDWYIKYRPITLKTQPSCGIWKRHTLGLTNIQQMLVCT